MVIKYYSMRKLKKLLKKPHLIIVGGRCSRKSMIPYFYNGGENGTNNNS